MKHATTLFHALVSVIIAAASAAAQQSPQAPPQPDRALGTLSAIGVSGGQISLTVKTDGGGTITVLTVPETTYRRVAPGARTLAGAEATTPTALKTGDRVLTLGKPGTTPDTLTARMVVVMTSEDLSAKRERERKLWDEGGVIGTVLSTDVARGEITAAVPGRKEPLVITTDDSTSQRRFATNSVKYEDSKPGTLAQIKVGDRLRARGRSSADSSRFAAAEMITGTFKTFFATVTRVNADGSEFEAQSLDDNLTYTIRLSAETTLRALPKDLFSLFTGGAGARNPSELLPEASRSDLKPGIKVSVTAVVEDGAEVRLLTAAQVMTNVEALLALRRGPTQRGAAAPAPAFTQATGRP